MPLQHDLLRFSKIGLPGLDNKCKSEEICVTVFQYYPHENGLRLKGQIISGFGGLRNQCGIKSSDLFW